MITQFAIGIILIIATVVVFQQLRFGAAHSTGFDKDQVIFMDYDASSDAVFRLSGMNCCGTVVFRESLTVQNSQRTPARCHEREYLLR